MVAHSRKVSRVVWWFAIGIGGAVLFMLRSGPSEESPAPDAASARVAPESQIPDLAFDSAEMQRQVPEPSEGVSLATVPTGALPSFESTLEASFRARSPFSAAKSRTIPPTYSVSEAIAAKHLNPEGKQLNAQQQEQLRELLSRQAEEENKLHREDKQAREQAFLRAIQRGSYRECSVPTVIAAGAPSEADSEALRKEMLALSAEVTKQLESTWGREHQDWTRTFVPVAGADGRLRQYAVFYARQEEPGTFAAWDRVHERFRAHRQQLQDFFAAVR